MKRRITALLAALLLLAAAAPAGAELKSALLTEVALTGLEEGNPFALRYEQLTGTHIEPLFPQGVPYFFGGIGGKWGKGWFFASYPYYHKKICEHGSDFFVEGQVYLYGLDCAGFLRYVYINAGRYPPPTITEITTSVKTQAGHVFPAGTEMPAFDRLKDTLEPGDLLAIRHREAHYGHIMMYIGTLRDFGYTAEDEPELAPYLDYPLVIHCGTSPFYGERFQKLIDESHGRYRRCLTTDGGVAVSIVGVDPEAAPVHVHVQQTDFDLFEMKDGGYQLTVINMNDLEACVWYRQDPESGR